MRGLDGVRGGEREVSEARATCGGSSSELSVANLSEAGEPAERREPDRGGGDPRDRHDVGDHHGRDRSFGGQLNRVFSGDYGEPDSRSWRDECDDWNFDLGERGGNRGVRVKW